jgi:hypothetical protein
MLSDIYTADYQRELQYEVEPFVEQRRPCALVVRSQASRLPKVPKGKALQRREAETPTRTFQTLADETGIEGRSAFTSHRILSARSQG